MQKGKLPVNNEHIHVYCTRHTNASKLLRTITFPTVAHKNEKEGDTHLLI